METSRSNNQDYRNVTGTPYNPIYAPEQSTVTYRPLNTAGYRQITRERKLIGNLPEFKPITTEAMKEIYPFIINQQARTTDFTYCGIWMWVNYFHYEYCIYADTLFMKGDALDGKEEPVFSCPIGALSLNASLDLIKRYCRKRGLTPRIFCSDYYADMISCVANDISLVELRDWEEYLYDIEKLSTFAGKKLSKKRNHLNFFNTNYSDCDILEITSADIDDVIRFCQKFHENHDSDEMASYETNATMECVRNLDDCHCTGLVIRHDGKVIGFTMGEIAGDTLIVHIEKGDIEYRGVYQALCSNYCSMEKSRHPELIYVNREDDSGNENLRKSKISYYPCGMVKKFIVNL